MRWVLRLTATALLIASIVLITRGDHVLALSLLLGGLGYVIMSLALAAGSGDDAPEEQPPEEEQ